MISGTAAFRVPQDWSDARRVPTFAGMGHQKLVENYLEELRKQQAKANGEFVDQVKRAGGDVDRARGENTF